MYHDGYRNIVNIDYSKIVIENMKKRCAHMPEMKCESRGYSLIYLRRRLRLGLLNPGLEMDIRDLKFDNESFDVVIDKGIHMYTHLQRER